MADPFIGELLLEPYIPPAVQPGGPGTPVTDPTQKPGELTGMFTAGCSHFFNNWNIRQAAVNGVPMKIATCPLCGYVQSILTVAAFDNNPFTFIA